MSRWRLHYLRVYNCRQRAASEQCTDTYICAYRLQCDTNKGKTRPSAPCSANIPFLGSTIPSVNTLPFIPFSGVLYTPNA